MADVQVTFGANISELTEATKRSSAAIADLADQVKSKFASIGDTIAAAAAAFGIGFGADTLKNWIAGEAALGEQIENAAAKLGTTAQQASQLSGIATLTGTAFEALQTNMERFNLNLGSAGNSTSKAAQGLKALGLSAREFVGVPIPQQLELLAEAASKFADGGNKTAAVMAILGRSGAEMIPYLDRGKEGMERLAAAAERTGAVMSNDEAAAFAKTQEDLNEMGLAWQGLSNKIFDAVDGPIDAAIRQFTRLIEGINATDINAEIQAIAAAFGRLAIQLSDYVADIVVDLRELREAFSFDFGDVYFARIHQIEQEGTSFKAQIHDDVAAINREVQGLFAQKIQGSPFGSIAGLRKEAQEYQDILKPQAGAMQIGAGADEAVEHQIAGLDREIAAYKSAEQLKQQMIENEVKMRTMSAQAGAAATLSALNEELSGSMAVYAKETALLQGKSQKLDEVLKKEQALQLEYAKQVQTLQIDAANKVAQQWKQVTDEINSAFDSQISGLIKGTTSWQKAFQNILDSLLTDVIKFFVNAGLQEAEYIALQLAGQKAVTMGAEASAAIQLASNAGKIIAALVTDAKAVFGAVFAFLAPELGPAAAVPAAAAAGTVAAGSYAVGSWELPSDMFAQVHKGEMIVPAARTPWAQSLMENAAGHGGGDTHIHHHNWNVNVNGAQDPSAVADALESQVKRIGKAFARATGTKMPRFT